MDENLKERIYEVLFIIELFAFVILAFAA